VLYIGCTSDLKKRLYFHKNGLIPGFSKRYNVNQLIYFEVFDSKEKALERETQIKKYRREKKINLINQNNPSWKEILLKKL
jgi:putative endonuclease